MDGRFVPLALQDTSLWNAQDRRRGDECLRRASALGQIGRFQLEAAISAVHSSRADTGITDWNAVVVLYRGLLQLAPTVGATIGAASARIEVGDLDEASGLLDSLPEELVRTHQPYWVCRSRLARALDDGPAARAASQIAIGLTTDPAVRAYLVDTRPR